MKAVRKTQSGYKSVVSSWPFPLGSQWAVRLSDSVAQWPMADIRAAFTAVGRMAASL